VGNHQLSAELLVAIANVFETLVGGFVGGIVVDGGFEKGGGEREGFKAS